MFITAPMSDAFHIFHYSHTIPHLQAGGLNTPFFVSHYICGDEDSVDTDIGQLPAHLRWPNGPNKTVHASVRFRFRETGGFEQALNNIIPANCWKSGFLPFDPKDGLSGGRFSDYPTTQVVDHERRAQMVGEILHWNTRMYLDSFRPAQGGFRFEENLDVNNRLLGGNPIQSTVHMILNPRFLADDVKVTFKI